MLVILIGLAHPGQASRRFWIKAVCKWPGRAETGLCSSMYLLIFFSAVLNPGIWVTWSPLGTQVTCVGLAGVCSGPRWLYNLRQACKNKCSLFLQWRASCPHLFGIIRNNTYITFQSPWMKGSLELLTVLTISSPSIVEIYCRGYSCWAES